MGISAAKAAKAPSALPTAAAPQLEGKKLSETQVSNALRPFGSPHTYTYKGGSLNLHSFFKKFLENTKDTIPDLAIKLTGSSTLLVAKAATMTPMEVEAFWHTIPDCDILIEVPEHQRESAVWLFEQTLSEVTRLDAHSPNFFKRSFNPQGAQEKYSLRSLEVQSKDGPFSLDFSFKAKAPCTAFSCQALFIDLTNYFRSQNKNLHLNCFEGFILEDVLAALAKGQFYAQSISHARQMREGLFLAARLYTRGLYLADADQKKALIQSFNDQRLAQDRSIERFTTSHFENNSLRKTCFLLNLYTLLRDEPDNPALQLIAHKLQCDPRFLIAFFCCNHPTPPIEIPLSHHIIHREPGAILTDIPLHSFLMWVLEQGDDYQQFWDTFTKTWGGETADPHSYLEKNLPRQNSREGTEFARKVLLHGRTIPQAMLHLFSKHEMVPATRLKLIFPKLPDTPKTYSLVDLITTLDSKELLDAFPDPLALCNPKNTEELGAAIALFQHMGRADLIAALCKKCNGGQPSDPDAVIAYLALEAFQNKLLIQDENGKFRFQFHIPSAPIDIHSSLRAIVLSPPKKVPLSFTLKGKNFAPLLEKYPITDPDFCFRQAVMNGTWQATTAIVTFFDGKERAETVLKGLELKKSPLLFHFQQHHHDPVAFFAALIQNGIKDALFQVKSLQVPIAAARKSLFPKYGDFKDLTFSSQQEAAEFFATWANTKGLPPQDFKPYLPWIEEIPALKQAYIDSITRECATKPPKTPIARLNQLLDLQIDDPIVTEQLFSRLGDLSKEPADTRYTIWNQLLNFSEKHPLAIPHLIKLIPSVFQASADAYPQEATTLQWILQREDNLPDFLTALLTHNYSHAGKKLELDKASMERYSPHLPQELKTFIILFSKGLLRDTEFFVTPLQLEQSLPSLKEPSRVHFFKALTKYALYRKSTDLIKQAVYMYAEKASTFSTAQALVIYVELYSTLRQMLGTEQIIVTLHDALPANICQTIPKDLDFLSTVTPFVIKTLEGTGFHFSIQETLAILSIWRHFPDHEQEQFQDIIHTLIVHARNIQDEGTLESIFDLITLPNNHETIETKNYLTYLYSFVQSVLMNYPIKNWEKGRVQRIASKLSEILTHLLPQAKENAHLFSNLSHITGYLRALLIEDEIRTNRKISKDSLNKFQTDLIDRLDLQEKDQAVATLISILTIKQLALELGTASLATSLQEKINKKIKDSPTPQQQPYLKPTITLFNWIHDLFSARLDLKKQLSNMNTIDVELMPGVNSVYFIYFTTIFLEQLISQKDSIPINLQTNYFSALLFLTNHWLSALYILIEFEKNKHIADPIKNPAPTLTEPPQELKNKCYKLFYLDCKDETNLIPIQNTLFFLPPKDLLTRELSSENLFEQIAEFFSSNKQVNKKLSESFAGLNAFYLKMKEILTTIPHPVSAS